MLGKLKNIGTLILPIAVVAVGLFVTTNNVSAAACTNTANYGSVTKTVNVPAAGDYRIWSRIKVPNAANSTYQLEANGNTCWQVGGSNVPTNTWTWVDWYGGNTAQKVNYTFNAAGNYPLKLIGSAVDVQVDKVILLGVGEQCSDGSTTPTGDGANCASAPVPPTISSFSASPATVTVSNATTLNWVTANTTTCSIGGGPTNTTTKSWQTQPFTTTGTKSYTLTCKNALGTTVTATTTVTVNPAPTPPTNVTLTASSTNVTPGTSVLLEWGSVGSTSCTLNPGNYTASGTNSSKPLNVNATTTYTVTCSNNAGSASASKTVTVTPTPPAPAKPVITSFVASAKNVAYGGKVTLTWQTSNVTTKGCALVPSPNTSADANSSWESSALTSSVSYTLTCKNSINEVDSESLSVTVANAPAPVNPGTTKPEDIPAGTNDSTVTAPTGQSVVNTQASGEVTQGQLATLDTSTVTDGAKVETVLKVEFYDGEELVQTVTEAPFALDTNKLSPGSHNITQRTYFKDGSSSTQSQIIEVQGTQDVQGAVATKNGTSQLLVGIGSVLALIVAIAFGWWFFMLRPMGYSLKEGSLLMVGKTTSFIGGLKPGSSPSSTKADPDKSYYAEPTIITPDNKKDL